MAKTERGRDMADTHNITQAYDTLMEYMDLLTDDQVDKLELRATQIIWDRYHRDHYNDDFLNE